MKIIRNPFFVQAEKGIEAIVGYLQLQPSSV